MVFRPELYTSNLSSKRVDDKVHCMQGRRLRQMKALVVHPGTQYSFRLAGQLERLGCLSRFWTGLAYVPNSTLGRCVELLPKPLRRRLANRRLDGVSTNNLRTQVFTEWRSLRRLRAGHDCQEVMFERNEDFQRRIPRREFANCDVVIGFDTSSWLLAERTSALGRSFCSIEASGIR